MCTLTQSYQNSFDVRIRHGRNERIHFQEYLTEVLAKIHKR